MKKELIIEKIKPITIFLGLYLLIIPMNAVTIGGFSIVRFFVIVPILLSLLQLKNKTKNKKSRNLIVYSLVLFLIFTIIQIFYTEYVSVVFKNFTQLAMYAILVLLVTRINYNDKEKSYLKKMFALSSWFCILLVIFFRYDFMNYRLTYKFPGSNYEDPNYLCGYFIPGIIMCVNKIFTIKKIKFFQKIFYLVSLIIMLYIVFLTGSRGGLLAIFFAMFLILMHNEEKKYFTVKNLKKLLMLVIVGGILIYVGSLLIDNLNVGILNRLSLKNIQETSGNGRYEIWSYLFEKYSGFGFLKKILGYGFGTTYVVIAAAHNTWITLLFENGLFGILIFGCIIWTLAKIASKSDKYYWFILMAYIVFSMTLSLIFYKPLWGLIIMLLINDNYNKEVKE